MESDTVVDFKVTVDVKDLRGIYNRYGQTAVDAAVDKIANDLKYKIKATLKLSEQTGIIKPLVEAIR